MSSEIVRAAANPIYLCGEATDMRCSFDGLKARVTKQFKKLDQKALYVFVSKNFKRCKMLYWDKNGWAIWYKQVEKGVFRTEFNGGYDTITGLNLKLLTAGIDTKKKRVK